MGIVCRGGTDAKLALAHTHSHRTTRPVSVSLSSVDVSESVCVCVRLQCHSSTVAVDVLLECVIFLTMLSKCARWTRTTVDDMRIAKHIQYFIYLFMFRLIRLSYPRLLGFIITFATADYAEKLIQTHIRSVIDGRVFRHQQDEAKIVSST